MKGDILKYSVIARSFMVGTGTGSSLCHCEQSEAIPVVYEIATPSARHDFLIAFAGERSFCPGVIIRGVQGG